MHFAVARERRLSKIPRGMPVRALRALPAPAAGGGYSGILTWPKRLGATPRGGVARTAYLIMAEQRERLATEVARQQAAENRTRVPRRATLLVANLSDLPLPERASASRAAPACRPIDVVIGL